MNVSKCRICLTSTNLMMNIFNYADSEMISNKIMSLSKVQIYPNDGLPNSICKSCNRKLENCIDFIKLCEKSDNELRNGLIVKKRIKKIKENFENDFTNEQFRNLSPIYEVEKEENVLIKTEQYNGISNDNSNLIICDKLAQKRQCFTCGKIMSSSFRLKTHLSTHTGEKPYSCQYCKKKFSLAQNLNVHLRIHTGEKPFTCTTCGDSFAQSSGLTAHKRKHTGQTPYKCVLCPRSFRTVGHLQYHIRRHTGEKKYECDTCNRAFITRSDLKQHLMTHSGEKMHVCCICGIRFSRASNLKRHTKYSHCKEKLFTCTQCPLKFVRKNDLAKHENEHKNEIKIN